MKVEVDLDLLWHIVEVIAYHLIVMVGVYALVFVGDIFADWVDAIQIAAIANTWMKASIGVIVTFSALAQTVVLLWRAFLWSLEP